MKAMALTYNNFRCFKGAGSRNVNKLLSKERFLIGHNTQIFHYFSQNKGSILKINS